MRTIQDASICSKVLTFQTPPPKGSDKPHGFEHYQLPVATLLYLATMGGAQLCNLTDRVGSLRPGKAFDALLVSVRTDAGNPGVWGADTDSDLGIGASDGPGWRKKTEKEVLEGILERFIFCGDDRNIKRVYVQGKMIGGKEFQPKAH